MKTPTSQTVLITPDLAAQWLIKNTNNRPLTMSRVQSYVRDIQTGQWKYTHQGIAFYVDGTLADGQHRLKAISMSNIAVPMLVTHNLPKEVSTVLDQNKPRTLYQSLNIEGKVWVRKEMVAIARCMLSGGYTIQSNQSPSVIEDYLDKYRTLLEMAVRVAPTKKRAVTQSVVLAAYFTALVNGVEFERVRRFASVLYSGEISKPEENAAIRVRELLSKPIRTASDRFDRLKLIQRGIQLFVQDQKISRLHIPAALIYPIPE